MNSKKITLTIGTFLLLMFSMVTPVFANPDAPVCNKGVNSTDMIWLIPYFIYTVYQQFPIIQNLITIILLTILFLINLKPIDFKMENTKVKYNHQPHNYHIFTTL